MTRTEFPLVSTSPLLIELSMGDGGDAPVVWLRGEHDVANAAELSQTLAVATAATGGGLVIDMSGVEFMDASTVGAIVGARKLLRARSRDLTLRSPSRASTRLLDICGLGALIEPPAFGADALATWVKVPRSPAVDPP